MGEKQQRQLVSEHCLSETAASLKHSGNLYICMSKGMPAPPEHPQRWSAQTKRPGCRLSTLLLF
jgi:hypothetical protein